MRLPHTGEAKATDGVGGHGQMVKKNRESFESGESYFGIRKAGISGRSGRDRFLFSRFPYYQSF